MKPLVCPSCGSPYPASERFCASCRVPLVFAEGGSAEAPVSERHERARKVKPQLAEGELVKVAGARNQAEAEFIQGLLLEEVAAGLQAEDVQRATEATLIVSRDLKGMEL